MPAPLQEKSVQVHAWAFDTDGGQDYADADLGEPHDGWAVYLRVETPDDPQQPFDCRNDQDFTTKEEALTYAGTLAAQHNALIDIY